MNAHVSFQRELHLSNETLESSPCSTYIYVVLKLLLKYLYSIISAENCTMLVLLLCVVFVAGTGSVSEDHECYLVDMCAFCAYVNFVETFAKMWR